MQGKPGVTAPVKDHAVGVGVAKIPASESETIMQLIARAQSDPKFDVAKLEQLFNLYERAKNRSAQEEYNAAVTCVIDEMPRITKSKKVMYDIDKNNKAAGQQEAFKYAPLEDIDAVVKPLLKKHKLRDSYTTRMREGGGAIVVGKLTHVNGHSEECELPLALDTSGGKNNIQGMGSTFAYGRRYTLCGLLAIVVIGDDDDAQSLNTIDENTQKKLTEDLKGICVDIEVFMPKFLEFMKVKSLDEILVGDMKKANNMITAKRRGQKKKLETATESTRGGESR